MGNKHSNESTESPSESSSTIQSSSEIKSKNKAKKHEKMDTLEDNNTGILQECKHFH